MRVTRANQAPALAILSSSWSQDDKIKLSCDHGKMRLTVRRILCTRTQAQSKTTKHMATRRGGYHPIRSLVFCNASFDFFRETVCHVLPVLARSASLTGSSVAVIMPDEIESSLLSHPGAGVAQLVEQRFRKPQVARSIRVAGSSNSHHFLWKPFPSY